MRGGGGEGGAGCTHGRYTLVLAVKSPCILTVPPDDRRPHNVEPLPRYPVTDNLADVGGRKDISLVPRSPPSFPLLVVRYCKR